MVEYELFRFFMSGVAYLSMKGRANKYEWNN